MSRAHVNIDLYLLSLIYRMCTSNTLWRSLLFTRFKVGGVLRPGPARGTCAGAYVTINAGGNNETPVDDKEKEKDKEKDVSKKSSASSSSSHKDRGTGGSSRLSSSSSSGGGSGTGYNCMHTYKSIKKRT